MWSAISFSYNSRLPATRQLGPLPMLGLWAVLTLTGALYSAWLGNGGRAFAATFTAFAFFFLVTLLFAARGFEDRLASRFGAGSGYLLGAAVFLVYLIYALGPNTFAFTRAPVVVALALALPGRPSFLHLHRAPVRQRRAGMLLTPPPRQRRRLQHRLGPSLELLHPRQLHRLRLRRHSTRPR